MPTVPTSNGNIARNGRVLRVWFFGSDAPLPFRLDSWYVTSQKVYAVKHRG